MAAKSQGQNPDWKQTAFAIVAFVVLIVLVGFVTSQIRVIAPTLNALAGIEVPPFLGWMESVAPVIAYGFWIVLALSLLYVLFVASPEFKSRLVESTQTQDVLLGLVTGAVLSGLTGYLWAIWNPVPILPPFIHLRIFSFLVGVFGILIGRGTGFLVGYLGSIVWGLVAGYFVLPHTPVADGFWVGTMTGWFVAVMVRGNLSREQLLQKIEMNRWAYYRRCAWVGLVGGLVMSFFVASSLKVTTPLSWWASFWAIGALSDTLPMVVWLGPVSEAALRLTRRLTWLPNF